MLHIALYNRGCLMLTLDTVRCPGYRYARHVPCIGNGRRRGRITICFGKYPGQTLETILLKSLTGKHAHSSARHRSIRLEAQRYQGSEEKGGGRQIYRKRKSADQISPCPKVDPIAIPEDDISGQRPAQSTAAPRTPVTPINSVGTHGRLSADSSIGRLGAASKACYVEQQGGDRDITITRFFNHGTRGSTWVSHNDVEGHFPGEALMKLLAHRLLLLLPEVTPQCVANSLLGMAKLGWSPESDVMDRLACGSLPKIADFKPQELSNTLWALARLGHRNDELQTAIYQQALKQLTAFTPQGISNVVWAAATLGLRVQPLEDIRQGEGACSSDDLLGVLLCRCCDQARVTLQGYTSQNVANLVWANAKMGYVHKPLMLAVAGHAVTHLLGMESGVKSEVGSSVAGGGRSGVQGWGSQEVANITWAFATLGFQPGNLFLSQVCRHLSSPRYLPSYKWQELSNTVWALAVLGHHDNPALNAVDKEVAKRTRSVANPTSHGEVAEEVPLRERLLVPAHPDLRPQSVSNLMWAFASLQHPAPELFAALLPLLRHRHNLDLFSEQELSNCIWAAARLSKYDEEVMDTVAEHICHHCLPLLNPQALANIAWAYGELRHDRRDLFDGLVEALLLFMFPSESTVVHSTLPVTEGRRAHVKLQELNSTFHAACVFGWRYPKLLDTVIQLLEAFASHGQLKQIDGESGPRVVISADLGGGAWRPPEGLQELEARALCNLAWALSLLGACSPQLWGQVIDLSGRMLATQLGGGSDGADGRQLSTDEDNLAQVYQAYLYVQLDHPNAVLAPGPLGLIERAANVWRLQSCTSVQVSSFQEAVSLALTRLGLRHRAELLTSDGAFSIDLAIEVEVKAEAAVPSSATGPRPPTPQSPGLQGNADAIPIDVASSAAVTSGSSFSGAGSLSEHSTQIMRVAVEVDGPWHFTTNTRRPLSTTLYRHRCLEARGWRVVSVPFWRWSECKSSFTKQDMLLREVGLQDVLEAVKWQ